MLDLLTSVLELVVVVAGVAALAVTAVILGSPWCWPVGLVAVAVAAAVTRMAVAAAVRSAGGDR